MDRYYLMVAVIKVDDHGHDVHEEATWLVGEATTDLDALTGMGEACFQKVEREYYQRIPAATRSAVVPDPAPADEERFLRMVESCGGEPRLSGLYGPDLEF